MSTLMLWVTTYQIRSFYSTIVMIVVAFSPRLSNMTNQMFKPFKIGNLELQHRIVLAPLTRMRAPQHLPNALMEEYYAQRTTPGGLLISEGIHPSIRGIGYKTVPGIWTQDQTKQWTKIVDGVHAKKGFIFAQIWHVGRASKFSPVSSTDKPLSAPGSKAPHKLTVTEIIDTVEEFVQSAKNAKTAGFDGIEIHAANGYLLQQFLDSTINHRTDEYGGSFENRFRFLHQVIEAVLPIFPNRVGLRLSPYTTFNDTAEFDEDFWKYVVAKVNEFPLAYLHLVEPRAIGGGQDKPDTIYSLDSLLKINKLPLILAGGFNEKNYDENENCCVAFGRYFISNPTLVNKLKNKETLTPYDRATFYSPGAKGYTTYA